jgi:cob(I)alamin adenosyltransferase
MVTLSKIYTRTGDKGDSGLVGGERRAKSDPRFAAIGTVDETNAAIGLARLEPAEAEIDLMLSRIQNDLFDLGSDLATPGEKGSGGHAPLRITDTQVKRLEDEIDQLNAHLAPLNSFVLPGGGRASAALHFARTVSRRAERDMVALAQTEPVSGPALRYINRLSDFLFVAARFANDRGARDVLWVPGANSQS